jgi:hypothetical protein
MNVENKRESQEMTRFNEALRGALSVSKSDLKRLLEEDKITPLVPQKRGRKPKASSHASPDKD